MDIKDIESMKDRAKNCKECLGKALNTCFECENQVAMEEIIELCDYTQHRHNKVIKEVINSN